MAADAAAVRAPAAARRLPLTEALGGGFIVGYLSLVVLLPLAALVAEAGNFRHAVTNREAVAALELTLVLAVAVALANAIIGTATAWVLVRDDFRGKRFLNAVIDLPFALPTIVAGLTLLALYGPRGWTGVNLAFTWNGLASQSISGFGVSQCRLAGISACPSASTVLIRPATPAAASRWPTLLLTDPTAQAHGSRDDAANARVSAAISIGSPIRVPVPCASM